MIKVASYCRVSSDKADQANSFESQQRFFREYIAQNQDWELYAVYADEGITGTSTQKRTRFKMMLADAREGKFQLILTKEISRFSRNILDTIRYTRELKSMGIGVLFLTENLNTLNPESEMLLTFMGTIAQEESRRTSIRVKWGQTRRMEQGVVFGRSLLGYDVSNGNLTVNPEGSGLVQLIFHKYGIEKKGTSVIARELQEAGYHTLSGSKKWHPSHIIKILKNEKYVGDLVQKKTFTPDYLSHAKRANRGHEELVIIRDHHTPIIDRVLWNTVQSEIRSRDKHNKHSGSHSVRHLFSGKICCGECGAIFVARQRRLKDGRNILRWRCSAADEGCKVGKLLRDDDALNMLKAALQSLSLDRKDIAAGVAGLVLMAGKTEDTGTQHLERELAKIEEKKLRAMDAYLAGDISRGDFLAITGKYTSQSADITGRLAASEGENARLPDRITLTDTLTGILTCKQECDIFYRSMLEHITVFRDRHMELKLKDLPDLFTFTE